MEGTSDWKRIKLSLLRTAILLRPHSFLAPTAHLSVGPVHFSLFLSSPNGRGKNLFSFLSPSSRTVPFFAGYHRNILSISSVRKGRQEQKGGMSAFLSGLPFRPFQPLHPVNEGCCHRIEEPCYTLFCL